MQTKYFYKIFSNERQISFLFLSPSFLGNSFSDFKQLQIFLLPKNIMQKWAQGWELKNIICDLGSVWRPAHSPCTISVFPCCVQEFLLESLFFNSALSFNSALPQFREAKHTPRWIPETCFNYYFHTFIDKNDLCFAWSTNPIPNPDWLGYLTSADDDGLSWIIFRLHLNLFENCRSSQFREMS